MKSTTEKTHSAFCIYVTTLCEGAIPIERNERGMPVIYATLLEAQHVIAEDLMERLRQFLAGERDFDDAMTVEEYIVEVDAFPDGSICDEDGNYFGKATN